MQTIFWCRHITVSFAIILSFSLFHPSANAANSLECIETLESSVSPRASAIISCLKQVHSAKENRENEGEIPAGTIVAWFGSGSIPRGWAICNGDNGTPDLRGQFLRGVGTIQEIGKDNDASDTHSHAGMASATQMPFGQGSSAGTSKGNDDSVWTLNAHTHPLIVSTGSSIPPNFKVVYIMKIGEAR